jgi:hypothetical protein
VTSSEDEELEWDSEDRFVVQNREVEILMRMVPRPSVLREDLLPFFHTSGVWIHSGRSSTSRYEGLLARYAHKNGADYFTLTPTGVEHDHEIIIDRNAHRKITVWRFAGILNMLQVHIVGRVEKLYAQTGGAAALSLMAELLTTTPADYHVRRMLDLYQAGGAEPSGAAAVYRRK